MYTLKYFIFIQIFKFGIDKYYKIKTEAIVIIIKIVMFCATHSPIYSEWNIILKAL